VPRCTFQGVREVSQFVEKPPAEQAERLLVQGGLWNTFVTVGPGAAFWALARRHMPLAAELLGHYADVIGRPAERNMLLLAYARMPLGNFSRDVLEQAHGLLVARASGTGWSDWGCPRRVFESLQGSTDFDHLLARISRPVSVEGADVRAL
jgi:mannose-1-phosphate guanylyltransferase